MRRNRTLLALRALTAGAEVLGFSHQTLLPSLARDVLQSGPEGLGVLNAARAVGGMLGLSVSMREAVAGGGTMFLAVLAGFGLSIVGLGLAPHLVGFWGVVLILVVVNAVGARADLLAQSLLQLGSLPAAPAGLRRAGLGACRPGDGGAGAGERGRGGRSC